MSYEFGFVLSFAQLKFLRLWFVRLDTERKPSNYTTRVNGVKFFRAGVCTPTRARARVRPKSVSTVVRLWTGGLMRRVRSGDGDRIGGVLCCLFQAIRVRWLDRCESVPFRDRHVTVFLE